MGRRGFVAAPSIRGLVDAVAKRLTAARNHHCGTYVGGPMVLAFVWNERERLDLTNRHRRIGIRGYNTDPARTFG
ncbi:MAG: hypothetical protein ACPG4T_23770 [Nannocystaceae bacterium]